MTPNSHTKFERNRPSRSWNIEARCARAHVQRHPTRDYCINCNEWVAKCISNFKAIGPTVTSNRNIYGKGVRTCPRADALHPQLVEGTWLMTPNPHIKFEHNRLSRFRDTEARCGGIGGVFLHVRTCRDTPPVTTA